jgi:DNA repair exonuclease SbcCD ATPase subunit
MRLRRLELQNFRNYRHLVLDFPEPRTLFIGENGIGKSTVFDAVQWLITGQCRGVAGNGAGQKDLIKLGQDATTVTGIIDGLGPITRTISRNGSASSSLPSDAIMAKLGVNQNMVNAVLDGRSLFGMHHADAKAMLMQVLNVGITKDQLPGVKLPDTVVTVSLDYLEQLYDQAFKDRAAAKKALASAFVPEQPKVVSIDLGGKNLADVQRELAKDQNALQTAIRDQARAEQRRDAIKAQIEAATKLVAGVEQQRGALKAHQDMLADHRGQLAAAEADLKTAEAEPAEPVGSLEIQVREAASLVDKIERHTQAGTQPAAAKGRGSKKNLVVGESHGCVLSAAIPCLTAISEFQGQVATLKAQQKDLEARIKAGNERARKIAAAQQAVKGSERQVTYHEGQIRDVEAKIAAADQARASLPALQDDAAAAEAAVTAGHLAIGDQRSDVDRRQKQVAELATYEQAQRNHQAAVERRADLEKQVTEADNLVTLLGPKGIRLQALNDALGDFLQAINAALEPFGFEVDINVDPWKIAK